MSIFSEPLAEVRRAGKKNSNNNYNNKKKLKQKMICNEYLKKRLY